MGHTSKNLSKKAIERTNEELLQELHKTHAVPEGMSIPVEDRLLYKGKMDRKRREKNIEEKKAKETEGLTFKPEIHKAPKLKHVTVDLFSYKKKAK